MNTHNPKGAPTGHHGEFQAKSPNANNPVQHKTHVYRKDPKMSALERALDNIVPRELQPQFHAKKLNGNRRGDNNRRPMRSENRRYSHAESSPNKKKDIIPPLAPGDVRVIVIGGVEKIGSINMTAIEYKDQIVVVDAGFQFSDEDTPGIEFMIPNTKYLEERKHMIKALVVTHGHLDHIGALSFVMEPMGNPPIYTMEFGALLIKKRHEEYPHLPELDIKIVEKDDGSIPLSDDLKVRFFGVTHSIPDSAGVIIETPQGDIVSTGDVRVENNEGIATDEEYEKYEIFKNREVLLMTLDSTGIANPGWTISEKVVAETVDKIIRDTKGRLLIATFASQMVRIISFLESARRYGRMVVIEGRSMKTNMAIAKHLNLTDMSHEISCQQNHDAGNGRTGRTVFDFGSRCQGNP
jgi:ribonuclease J